MTKVTICRQWNNPQIAITVSNESLSIELSLDDFLIALADEVAEPLVESIATKAGNPSFWFTKEAVTKNLVQAIEGEEARKHFLSAAHQIIEKIKQETSKVV